MELLTRDGRTWTPEYLIAIDAGKCIGCGRCFKVCGRGVMSLKGVTEDGEFVALEADADDDDDEEFERKVMTIADAGNCIGCGACARVCAKASQTHSSTPPALDLAA
jgi:Nif-specific ferredoxin III